ncbi:MAG TPA: circularly permuted type 2 ATP-grasp protein [Terrimicrobiaceae bacterium]
MAATDVSLSDPTSPSLLGYQLRLGSRGMPFDEMAGPDGSVRPHWREVAGFFTRLGPEEITRRWNQARKILHDNGAAYNVQSQGVLRPWELNPIPLCLAAAEWQAISRAVGQRARLLNWILDDLYGDQTLLANRLLPPALVLGNASYLRPCRGHPVRDGVRLALYAADVARAPNGSWWIVSDRTQSPSGMGYTLENRMVLSRVFSGIFRETRIARLGGFFERVRTALAALSPRPGLEPNAVLLTPGSLNETYFEQAYLARHLGCPLVQGQDLAVRDGRVFIKTLEGLRQVDIILRRVDDDYCDPLELRDDSLLGVPGLLNAVRAGTVTLANSLGSGLVQCAALNAFLPGLCRKVFGEELLMPSVATWWCGEDAALRYVVENLHGLVLKDAFEYPGSRPDRAANTEELRKAILARPPYFAAQEFVRLSQCPDFVDGRLEARSIVLRVFAVRVGEDYELMPGGLTRVAEEESSYGALMLQAGGSKDTWVNIEGESSTHGGAPLPIELQRSHLDLTSRVADNLFWLGRYADRAEFTARIVRSVLEDCSEESGWVEQADVVPLLATLRHFGQFSDDGRSGEPLDQSLSRQMADRSNFGSLVSVLQNLRGLAAAARDQISNDAWRILNILSEDIAFPDNLSASEAALHLNNVILALSAFHGLFNEIMPHGHAWRFADLGRRIERGMYLARLVAEVLREEGEPRLGRYELLLKTLDALATYRQKHAALRAVSIVDLVLCDESNPRSLAAQLALSMKHLKVLPRESTDSFKLPEERRLLKGLSDVRLLDTQEAIDPRGRAQARQTLTQVERLLCDCSELITHRFFTHLKTSSLGRDGALIEGPSET